MLLMEKANIENIVKNYSNMLIRAVKLIGKKVIGIEALK